MFNIFIEKGSGVNLSKISYAGFDYLRKRYRNDIDRILDYYRNREAAMINGHILYRLINSILPSIELSDVEFLSNVSNTSIYIARQLNITSNINRGIVHDNEFFGKNSLEVLLYTETEYDIEYIKNNYMTIDSVRVIYTDETDIDFNIPYNDKVYEKETLHVIEIDVIMLLMQYREWAKARIRDDRTTNINFFLRMVILPNMMPNMIDLAIYNRFIHLSNNITIPRFSIRHPIITTDYTPGVDKILKRLVKESKNKNMYIEQMINNIPTVYNDNMASALTINHQYFTTQSKWVLWIARVRVLRELFTVMNTNGIKRNLDILNMTYYVVKQLKRSRTIEDKFNKDSITYLTFQQDLDILLQMMHRR